MDRLITGFRQDEVGDWVADLDCLHAQHVRHQPPFRDRAWVLEPEGRAARVGTPLDCPLCDRAELPEGLVVARVAGPFAPSTIPAGLRRPHVIAPSTWGELRVQAGAVELSLPADAPPERITAGGRRALPPGVPHRLGEVEDDARFDVAFLVRPQPSSPPPSESS